MDDLDKETERRTEAVLVDGYRRMSPAEKWRRVADLNRALDELAAAGLRASRGEAISERELRLRLASRRLPAEIMRRVFDWDPDVDGY